MPYGTVNADLMTTSDGVSSAGLYGFKNRIINGAMVIDQRNAGASVTPANGAYTVDRWFYNSSQASKFTVQQNAGSVTPPAGFKNYLGCTVAASVSIGAADFFALAQNIEGLNVYDLAWGTANAQSVTLSFWVRSSLTGTFGGALQNSGSARSYPFSYTISSANTWEQKSITIAGDTSGTWLTTNGVGLAVYLGLGVGTTYSGTAGSWAGANYLSATGATSVVGTNGATFFITGVQLERGSTATSFDYRPYGNELALCQRYYTQFSYVSGSNIIPSTSFNNATTNGLATITLPVTMRTAPTGIVLSSASDFVLSTGASNLTPSSIAFTAAGSNTVSVNCTVTGATVGFGGLLYFTATAGAYIGVSGTEL
jgi:hypothetical protein